ncbi:MAG: hypothetical protein ACR2LE_07120 [Nocardioidaceae bacterium]
MRDVTSDPEVMSAYTFYLERVSVSTRERQAARGIEADRVSISDSGRSVTFAFGVTCWRIPDVS